MGWKLSSTEIFVKLEIQLSLKWQLPLTS